MGAKRSFMVPKTSEYGRFRLTVLAIFLVYNLTEAAYKVTSLMAFVLFLLAIESPADRPVAEGATAQTTGPPPIRDHASLRRPAVPHEWWQPRQRRTAVGAKSPL